MIDSLHNSRGFLNAGIMTTGKGKQIQSFNLNALGLALLLPSNLAMRNSQNGWLKKCEQLCYIWCIDIVYDLISLCVFYTKAIIVQVVNDDMP